MRRHKLWTAVISCCILLAGGCVAYRQSYTDRFDSDEGLWGFPSPALDFGVGAVIENGELIIRIEPPHRIAWADLQYEYTDFDVTVEATPSRDSGNDTYGILFRYVNGLAFYAFMVSVDGYYGVFRAENDVWVTLSDWHHSQAIEAGAKVNILRVVGRDGRFAFYVNDVQLPLCPGGTWSGANIDRCESANLAMFLEEHTFYKGRLALAAGCGDSPGAEVRFDNFTVR